MRPRTILLASSITLASLACIASCHEKSDSRPTTVTSAIVPKRTLIAEHATLARQVEEASEAVVAFSLVEDDAELKDRVSRLATHLGTQLSEHTRREESVVYELADQRTNGKVDSLTATLREEHRVIARWIADLGEAAHQDYVDRRDLVRRAHELIGLIRAHLEIEDRLLLPLLDRTMTWDELDRAMQQRSTPFGPP